jgi:hypothetical protein
VVAFAIAYHAVAIVLCLPGKMSPIIAAVLMPASSLVSLTIVFVGLATRRARFAHHKATAVKQLLGVAVMFSQTKKCPNTKSANRSSMPQIGLPTILKAK